MRRFWDKVDKSGSCWLWTGSNKPRGYGQIKVEGKTIFAHRLSWELAYGPIPEGLYVCHRCDVPACVRPDHLFLGTQTDNMADRDAKGRTQHGENHYKAKLCELDVWLIKNIEGQSGRAIAKWFDVCPGTVYDILNGKTWAHV